MAEPLPPDGYIRLKDAYDIFHYGWLGEAPDLLAGFGTVHQAFADRSDEANTRFVANLSRLAYGGKVVAIDGSAYEITADVFDRARFAQVLPLHNAGGIICFDKAHFIDWLKAELSLHLHDEIQNGELGVIEANERLKKLNLPTLHQLPPIDTFREAVLKEPYWTLPMVVAWMAWRNIDYVVKQYWPYAQHGGHWRDSKGPNQTKMGATWESADEPQLLGLQILGAFDTAIRPSNLSRSLASSFGKHCSAATLQPSESRAKAAIRKLPQNAGQVSYALLRVMSANMWGRYDTVTLRKSTM
jgi:hypothetical protein